MTAADYADDQVLLGNTPTQAESQQHNFVQAAGAGFDLNKNKIEFMCFIQEPFPI